MKTNDYIKFVTAEVVKYFDEPKEVRRARIEEKRNNRPPRRVSLFGLIPAALSISVNRIKNVRKESSVSRES